MIRLLLLMLFATPLRAQWPDPTWWNGTINCHSVMCAHPIPHLLGGITIDGLARGPWIAKPFRNAWWKRMLWVTVTQGTWEYFQLREGPANPYPVRYAVADVLTAEIGAGVLEAVLR